MSSPASPAPGSASPPVTPTTSRRIPVLIAVGVVLLAVTAGTGFVLGKNSAHADRLKKQLADAKTELSANSREVSDLETAKSDLETTNEDLTNTNSDLEDQVSSLKKSVAAANGLKRDTSDKNASASAPSGSHRMGEAAQVGEVILKPTGLDRASASGDSASYVLTITAKNAGSEPKDLFCGSDGAALTDAEGRRFDGDSVLGNTANCGDDLAPGLTATYKMKFKVPSGAKPAFVTLWDSSDFDGEEAGSADWAA